MTESEYLDYIENLNGWCTNCHDWTHDSAEPDAREYTCPECGKATVFGAEEALLLGLVTIDEDENEEQPLPFMPNSNPDPSLTPEEAAKAYSATYLPELRTAMNKAFLGGVAHAYRAAVEAAWKDGMPVECRLRREGAPWQACDPVWSWFNTDYRITPGQFAALSARLQEVERERDEARASNICWDDTGLHRITWENLAEVKAKQVARLTKERDSARATAMGNDELASRLRAELAEAQKTVQLQWNSERVLTQKLSVAETKNLQALAELERAQTALKVAKVKIAGHEGWHKGASRGIEHLKTEGIQAFAVVEKMRDSLTSLRAVLQGDFGHIVWHADAPIMMAYATAVEKSREALKASPSIALLEFAEKVHAEAWHSAVGIHIKAVALHEHFLASDTYRSLTRATGEAK